MIKEDDRASFLGNSPMSKNNVTFRLDSEKRAALDEIAASRDRNLSYILNEAISLYLEIYSWQLEEIRQGVAEAEAGDFASDAEVEAVFEKLTHAH
jgi:predicted transcriptional regulator